MLVVAFTTTQLFANVSHATAGINQTVNFQGRLLDSSGGIVPDGKYSIEFKIYQDGDGTVAGDTHGTPAGTLKWTEDYINNGTTDNNVIVKNGFLSVNLGSLNPFGSSVDWNQPNLWLSMNVAGQGLTCSSFSASPCSSGDGEMLPMKQLTASPYALNSGELGGLTAANFVQLAQGVQTDASSVPSIYINKTGTNNLVELQSGSVDSFTVGNTGNLTFGSNVSTHVVGVATAAASTAGTNLTVGAGTGGSGTGSTGGNLLLQGGNGGGTNGNAGNVTLDAGTITGTGAAGVVNLGVTNASAVNIASSSTATVQVGNSSFASGTQTINIGNNTNAGTGVTNVTIGSQKNASTTTINAGSGGVQVNGAVTTSSTINGDTLSATGLTFGAASSTVGLTTAAASTVGGNLNLQGGTGGSGTGSVGGNVAIQGGGAGGTSANGGDVTIQGGTATGSGVQGQVKIGAGGFVAQTSTLQTFTASANVNGVDSYSTVYINSTGAGPWTATVPAPTNSYTGRILYIQVGSIAGSPPNNVINIAPSGSSPFSMNANTVVALVWNASLSAWLNAGSSSSSGSFIQNQNATDQPSANFRISGTGQASSGFLGPSLDVSTAGTLSIGTNGTTVASTIQIGNAANAIAQIVNVGNNATSGSTDTVTVGNLLGTSTTTIQGGTGGIGLQVGDTGAINVGTATTGNTIQVGSTTVASGKTQAITIGGNTGANGTQNVTIGSSGGAAGTTTIQSKNNTVIKTDNGSGTQVQRATFDNGAATAGSLTLGNGTTGTAAGTFTVQGTASSAATSGWTVALQGGANTNGTSNALNVGGNITLQGGAGGTGGVQGQVQINSASGFGTAGNQNFTATSGSVTQANVDNYSAVDISANATGYTETVPAPTTKYSGRLLYLEITGSNSITLAPTNGTTILMNPSTAVTLIWNTTIGGTGGWINAGADSGSNSYIQNQNSSVQTTANFKISGVGQANTGFIGPSLDVASAGTLSIGTNATTVATTIQIGSTTLASGQIIAIGNNATGSSTDTVTIGNLLGSSATTIQGGASGSVGVQVGDGGTINVGTATTGNTIQIGSAAVASGKTQTINIGNTSGASTGTTNVLIGAGATAAGGTTQIQSKGATSISTDNGSGTLLQRATFDNGTNTTGKLTLGNGTTQTSTGTYTIQGTADSSTSAGWTLALQGGANTNGTSNSANNGGNITLQGGAAGTGGVVGQVQINSASGFGTAGNQNFTATSGSVTQANVDTYSAVDISANATGYTETVPAPTTKYSGRLLYLEITGSNSITLAPTNGTTILMNPSTAVTLIWNTTIGGTGGWINAGADSGSNSYIQNQNSSVQTTANFKISGVGQANTGFIGPSLDVASAGTLAIGTNATTVATTIQIGSTTLASGSQTIQIGNNNTAGSTNNLILGSGAAATAGTTQIQSKGATSISTDNGSGTLLQRATFDNGTNTTGKLTLGNGTTQTSTGTYTIQGTADSSTSAGWTLALQGGANTNGTSNSANNGGNLTLQGGAAGTGGVAGQVQINSASGFSSSAVQHINSSTTVTGIDANSTIYLDSTVAGPWTATIPAPNASTTFTGRLLYVEIGAIAGSAPNNYMTIAPSGGTSINMNPNTAVTLVWNATVSAWLNAGADGGSNNYIQNQNASVQTTANYKISGTGQANSGFIGPSLDVATAGALNIGTNTTTVATTIQLGSATLSSGSQAITIGGNNSGATQSVVIGSASGAASGTSTTTIQAKDNVTIATNGTNRATFASGGNNLYVGNASNSGTNATPSGLFTIQATSNSGTGAGEALTLQAGNSGSAANGANLTLSGGTSANNVTGLVTISTPTFLPFGSVQTCSGSATTASISQTSVDTTSTIRIASTSSNVCTFSLPNPTINGTAGAGRIIYVTGDTSSSSSFILAFNGGGTGNQVSMRANSSATMVWNGGAWAPAGASSSTTLQAAYDNTIQSSGGAELIVSKTSNTNGLTIRDSLTAPVGGPLLNVQSNTASNLLSVSSNIVENASDPGAETYDSVTPNLGGFPSGTWTATSSSTVTRNYTTSSGIATGQAAVQDVTTAANAGVFNTLTGKLSTGLTYNVSFSAKLPAGASAFSDMTVDYSKDGTTTGLTNCTSNQQIMTLSWTKVTCSFTVPSGVTTGNAIYIRQVASASRTFYIDNLSVTAASSQTYIADGGVDNAGSFGTNWTANSSTVTRSTTNGNDASDSVQITTTASTSSGVKNNLAVTPLASVSGGTTYLYRVTAYVQTQVTALTTFSISYNDGTNTATCTDYNTQAVSVSTTAFTKISCVIQTPVTASPSSPYILFSQGDTTVRTNSLFVDTASMTLANSTTPDVQIGSGTNGGPTTLFTLDSGSAAPIANDNQSLLGSMYYNTTLGKIQCYQAAGWGSCGSAPDTVVTISPEYTNAVMHGTGVGTMTSDLCSGFLGINDGSSSQPTICSSTQAYNFYKWTSPQNTSQPYSIYVTYQLPTNFKSFDSATTSIAGRVDNLTNASISYKVYNVASGGTTQCGSSAINVAASAANTWDPGKATGTVDPATCGFVGGSSILFKITLNAAQNANAYISNIGFTFSNN
jgi:hypothetical protein